MKNDADPIRVHSRPFAVQSPSLADLAEDLYERYRGLKSSPHTIARIRTALTVFLGYLADERRVFAPEALAPEHLHAFQSHLSVRIARHGLPMKPQSINSIVKGVRAFLDMLHERGHLTRSVSGHLRYVKLPDLLPASVLTHAQVKTLARKIDTATPDGIRDRAAIELLYSSGIRIGELETLTLQDVDLDRGIARVVGKGRKERYVPIGKTALRWLASYIRGVRPFMARRSPMDAGRRPRADAVFLNANGAPLRQHTLRDRIRGYGRLLGLDIPVTPHTFRRSCTSEMIKSNANLYHVKQLLGHKSFETLDHYARLDIGE
jgi:site-specific recombinase XerD